MPKLKPSVHGTANPSKMMTENSRQCADDFSCPLCEPNFDPGIEHVIEYLDCKGGSEAFISRFSQQNRAGDHTRVLIIGPMPPPFGGTTVSFKELVRDLLSSQLLRSIRVLNSKADAKKSFICAFSRLIQLTCKVVWSMTSSEVVMLNASNRRAVFFGAFLTMVSKFLGNTSVVRVFGGELHTAYSNAGFIYRKCAEYVFANSIVLLQTCSLVNFFRKNGKNKHIIWFPTSRNIDLLTKKLRRNNISRGEIRFVFAGWVSPEKGIDTIIDVFSRIPDPRISLDIYGEVMPNYMPEWELKLETMPRNVKYLGCVDSDTLRSKLGDYYCLVMPTRWNNEGYPGIIVEAFIAGIPVIASKIGPIPEIVDDSCGILVDPMDTEAWIQAIQDLADSPDKTQKLGEKAQQRGPAFDSRIWNCIVLPRILTLACDRHKKEK